VLDLARSFRDMLPRAAATPGPLDPFWYQPISGPTPSGIVVKPDTAMKVGAVFACMRVLRESLGTLPWRVHRRLGGRSSEPAPDNYLWSVLHTRPNRWQTPIEWKEMGVGHLGLRGNFYNRIVPAEGDSIELWPLNPDRMTVTQLPDRSLKYVYRPNPGQEETYSASEIFHVRGLSLNGVTGVSVLEYASNVVALVIAQNTHGASLFRNGGLPTFWISRPQGAKWTPDAKRNFREGWKKLHGGPENAGNPPLLQDGMELHELGLTNKDSQWLESLNAGAVDICRFFGVPPHMIGIRDQSPNANIEQLGLEFVLYTLGPLATRFEQAADRDLVLEPETYFTKFNLDALERADMMNRYQAHNIAVQGGWLTINEVRAEENRNPVDGGDTPLRPLNMQPAGGGPDWNQQGGQPGKGKKKAATGGGGGTAEPAETDEDDAAEGGKKTGRRGDKETRRGRKKEKARAAFSILLEDAAARIVSAELRGLESRAEKAAEDRDRWNLWASEFYRDHRAHVRKVLDPIVQAWLARGGQIEDTSAESALNGFLSEILDEADVPAALASWKTTRAGRLAELFKTAFFAA
jgi:HK97 family phage portal protein